MDIKYCIKSINKYISQNYNTKVRWSRFGIFQFKKKFLFFEYWSNHIVSKDIPVHQCINSIPSVCIKTIKIKKGSVIKLNKVVRPNKEDDIFSFTFALLRHLNIK